MTFLAIAFFILLLLAFISTMVPWPIKVSLLLTLGAILIVGGKMFWDVMHK
jgi:hypothetical protein